MQPYVLVVEDGGLLKNFFAYYDENVYSEESVCCAFDTVFKTYLAFNLKYPVESVAFWNFIQKAFFEIDCPKYDLSSSRVNAAISDFRGFMRKL